MYEEHARFTAPSDPATPVWRYMDFAKFVSLLHRSALFFPNAASLGDPYEGSYPIANVRLRPSWYGQYADSIESQSRGEKLRLLQSTLISCWHMNDVESAAMWRLYAGQGYGIAIQSTLDRLRKAFTLPQPLYIGVVRYLRYDLEPIPEGNLFDPFLHKRASFAHEQELRAITNRYVAPGTIEAWEVAKGPPPYLGDYVATDFAVLIERVYTSPASPSWYTEAVAAAAARFQLAAPVHASDLDLPPSY